MSRLPQQQKITARRKEQGNQAEAMDVVRILSMMAEAVVALSDRGRWRWRSAAVFIASRFHASTADFRSVSPAFSGCWRCRASSPAPWTCGWLAAEVLHERRARGARHSAMDTGSVTAPSSRVVAGKLRREGINGLLELALDDLRVIASPAACSCLTSE